MRLFVAARRDIEDLMVTPLKRVYVSFAQQLVSR